MFLENTQYCPLSNYYPQLSISKTIMQYVYILKGLSYLDVLVNSVQQQFEKAL